MLNFLTNWFGKRELDDTEISSGARVKRINSAGSSEQPIMADDYEADSQFSVESSDLLLFSSPMAYQISSELDSKPLKFCPTLRFASNGVYFANTPSAQIYDHILETLFNEQTAKRLRLYQEDEPMEGFWLDDDIIFQFCKTLEHSSPEFKMLEPSFLKNQDAFQRFVEKTKDGSLHRELKGKSKIAFAVESGHHWYGVAMDIEKNEVYVFDGLNVLREHKRRFIEASALMNRLNPHREGPTFKSLTLPRQTNMVDCGVVVCMMIQSFVQDRLTPTAQARLAKQPELDYGPFRSAIAVHLSCSNQDLLGYKKR